MGRIASFAESLRLMVIIWSACHVQLYMSLEIYLMNFAGGHKVRANLEKGRIYFEVDCDVFKLIYILSIHVSRNFVAKELR